MEITGTIKQILPMQSGTGKNGTWKKQEVIIETEGQYPKTVCIATMNKNADRLFTLGEKLTFHIDIDSREFNGKWYTNVTAWKIE